MKQLTLSLSPIRLYLFESSLTHRMIPIPSYRQSSFTDIDMSILSFAIGKPSTNLKL